MIKDLIFVLKMLGVTIAVLLFLQVKISEDTIENHFHLWVQESVFVGFFQDSVDAFIIAGKSGLAKVNAKAGLALSRITKRKSPDEERSLPFELKRHNEGKEGEENLPKASVQ